MAVAQKREISGATGPQDEHRRARKACHLDRRKREGRPARQAGSSNRLSARQPGRRAAGPTRARTTGGRNRQRERDRRAGPRAGHSSHAEKSSRKSSQTRAPTDNRTNRSTQAPASRSTASYNTKSSTLATGREAHAPKDRESSHSSGGEPTMDGRYNLTGSAGWRTEPERAAQRPPRSREPGIKGIGDRQRKAALPCERRRGGGSASVARWEPF